MTTKEYFFESNKKKDCLKQMINSRVRKEYYKMSLRPTKTSKKLQNKILKKSNFFKETDLFLVKDLSQITNILKDANDVEDQELIDYVEILNFNNEERDENFIASYQEELNLDQNL